MYEMKNGNILVKPEFEKELQNGIVIKQQRSRKDLMWGEVILPATPIIQKVLYPLYAASCLSIPELNMDTSEFHIIKEEDIVMTSG